MFPYGFVYSADNRALLHLVHISLQRSELIEIRSGFQAQITEIPTRLVSSIYHRLSQMYVVDCEYECKYSIVTQFIKLEAAGVSLSRRNLEAVAA